MSIKISICIATYNGEAFLNYQLNSIINNIKGLDIEIIIVDDASKDKSIEICQKTLKGANANFKIYKNKKNIGPVKSFEKSIKKAKGDLILLSDQDDYWPKNRIERMLSIFEADSNIELIVGDFTETDYKELKDISRNEKFKIHQETKYRKISLLDFVRKRNPFYGCCFAFKSSLIQSILPMPQWLDAHDRWIAANSIVRKTAYFYSSIVTIRGIHENC